MVQPLAKCVTLYFDVSSCIIVLWLRHVFENSSVAAFTQPGWVTHKQVVQLRSKEGWRRFMETKRCVYCHKLSLADAEMCNRCGHAFEQTGQVKFSNRVTKAPEQARQSRPSVPPASPHRAGHYSGLHPEDQPYHSQVMVVQHSPVPKSDPKRSALAQQNWIILPSADAVASASSITATAPVPEPELQPQPRHQQQMLPPPRPHISPSLPKKLWQHGKALPFLLIIACLLLLLTGSLLASLFLHGKPQSSLATSLLTAVPNQLRVNDTFTLSGSGFGATDEISFTRDLNVIILDGNSHPLRARTDERGTFSIRITVPADWTIGQHFIHATDEAEQLSVTTVITIQQAPSTPPLLQLSDKQLDLGADAPGVVSNKNITLINAGGGQLTWQASSDQSWLTVVPNSGTFSGKAVAAITANRGTLTPQIYTGTIKFTQQASSQPALSITVTMEVKGAAASFAISTVALTYSASTGQNPPDQTVIVQNSGGSPLYWTSQVTTGDGAPWLSVNPDNGYLKGNTSAILAVSVHSQNLAVGSYQGTIKFDGGVRFQVTVSLNVVVPDNLVASPPSLSPSTTAGQNPTGQIITLQNSGGQPVDWTASAATTDGASWLSTTPTSGHLVLNAKNTVTVNIGATKLKAGSYQGTLIFTYGASATKVPVSLTVSPPPVAAINLNVSILNFTAIKGTNPTPQAFTITDSGNAALNWAITEDTNGATYVPVSQTSGSLAPAKNLSITVSPNVAQASAGTITARISVSDSDPGTSVQSQQITITITIKDQAVISLSMSNMTCDTSSTFRDVSQLLVIQNTGSATLNWVAQSSTFWLYASVLTGSIPPGQSGVIELHCNSSLLSTGTYTASITIRDTDLGTPVAAQTVNVIHMVS